MQLTPRQRTDSRADWGQTNCIFAGVVLKKQAVRNIIDGHLGFIKLRRDGELVTSA